jgi:hypothetical protein
VDISMQQEQALLIARMLVKAGVPMFLAHPDPSARHGWRLPFGWETNEPDVSIVDQWRPPMALCAVTGHTFDLIDIDPRSGGSEDDLGAVMPRSYLTAETPSGGRHHFVKTLGVPSLDGKVSPGIDVKSGTLEGEGRGFAFIAPTVRASKVDGIEREYRWVVGPKGPVLPTPDQLAGDGSGGLLRARVLEIRRTSVSETPRRVPMSQARREWDAAIAGLATNVGHWRRNGWGGEAHSTLLAATTRLARLSPETAEAGLYEAFERAGAVPDADDLAKLHSAIEKAVPDIVVPDSELSSAESFFLGGAAPASSGVSLPFGAASAFMATPSGVAMTSGAEVSRIGLETNETSSPRRRFQPMSRAEAASIVAPASLVDGLLLSNTKARLSGPSGAGKTWVVLDLCAHVAAGMPWQGREVVQSRVLYVAGEGAPSFDHRITAWETKHGRPAEIDIIPDAPQIASDEDWRDFCIEMDVMPEKYGLIVFDTQGSVTVGMEENSNKDANIALQRLDWVRKLTHACLLLVHHTGHEDASRGRGASAWLGGLDTELLLMGTVKEQNLQLRNPKQKYIESAKPLKLRVEPSAGGLVLVPPGGGLQGTGGFFDGPQATEQEARVTELVNKIEKYYAAGGAGKPSVRALVQVLKVELGVNAKTETLRQAARAYMATLGMPVETVVEL